MEGTTTPPARRGRPGFDQPTVLRRSIELFNRKGYDATSMADLAAELGLSKSAIYHHVPGKEHLLAAALDEALDSLAEALDQVERDTHLPDIERLLAAVASSVAVLVEHLPAVTLLLRVHGNSEIERAALRRRREIDDRLAAMVRSATAAGELRDDIDTDLISRLVFGMVNSLVEWVRPEGAHRADDIARAVTELVFDGLRADKHEHDWSGFTPLQRRLA